MEETTDTSTVEAPFDPTTVDLDSPNINAVFRRVITDGEAVNEIAVNWVHNYSALRDAEDNQRPAWADLPIDQRIYMALPDTLTNTIARQVLNNPNRFVHELPCPPYQFDMDDGKLRIKAGAFEKHGTKAEWEKVIEQMQAEVEEMPDGIDTTDLPDITLELSITATTTYDIGVDRLLDGHEQYDGEIFTGDKDELEGALEEAIDNLDTYDLEIDLSYADQDELEMSSTDLDYCMRQVDG